MEPKFSSRSGPMTRRYLYDRSIYGDGSSRLTCESSPIYFFYRVPPFNFVAVDWKPVVVTHLFFLIGQNVSAIHICLLSKLGS